MVTSKPSDRATGSEAGITIVELLVAITILSVVLTTLTAAAMSIYRVTNHVTFQTDDQNQARSAISVISRDIRAAAALRQSTQPAFLLATGDRASFTANLENTARPVLVRLQVDDQSRLLEDTTSPTTSLPDAPVTWDTANDARVRYIAAFVVNDPNEPIFRYFDTNVVELIPGAGPCPVPGGTPIGGPCLNADQRRQIATVELSLTIASAPFERAGAFTVEHRVRLPNAS